MEEKKVTETVESTPVTTVPGKAQATASMVLGIISIVFWFFGLTAIISVILGIIGLVLASKSKAAGFESGVRTAGFICSLIGLVGGGITLIACVACAGAAKSAANTIYKYL